MRHGGYDRIVIITENDELLYVDGYENNVAKKQEEAINKTVAEVEEVEPTLQYGPVKSIRVTFTDGTNLVLVNAEKEFAE